MNISPATVKRDWRLARDSLLTTSSLGIASSGDSSAVDALLPLVYDQLRMMARRQLSGERKDHTLNATALVHEAYLKLVVQDQVNWQNRAHFFAIAAQAMRRILINYAKSRLAEKRGSGQPLVTLNEEVVSKESRAEDLVALDEALKSLKDIDERQSKIVEFKFFGGLTHEEIAEVMNISPATVKRDWRLARAWLSRTLGDK